MLLKKLTSGLQGSRLAFLGFYLKHSEISSYDSILGLCFNILLHFPKEYNSQLLYKYPSLYLTISTALAPAQSKKLFLAAESDHPRKPQLVTLSRTTHHGYPSPADLSTTLLQTTRRCNMTLERILLTLNKGKYKKEIS